MTDYSSVAFDFAILKQPVLYAQFDEDRFFSSQWGRGYFNYHTDGFGPVCATYEETKTQLLRMLENPVMAPEYQARVDNFFGPLDGHACERIVQAILDLDA